jgi:benzoate 4-monooxygenase
LAGQGSTAAAITTALYDLGLHSNFQSLIRTELATLPPSPPYTALWALPHLQAFLRESLRLSPPFPGVFERVVSAGAESSIPGVRGPLPLGTRVGCNTYVVLRSKEVFGDDAEVFRAERWLTAEGDEERKKVMEDAWVVFGRGSRGCIGKDIALMLVVRVVAEVCFFPSAMPYGSYRVLADGWMGRCCQGSISKVTQRV